MQNIDEFVDGLLRDKGMPSADVATKADLKEKVLDRIDQSALSHLSDEQLVELNRLVDDPTFDEPKMRDFIVNTGINIDEIATNTMQLFRNQYLAGGIA